EKQRSQGGGQSHFNPAGLRRLGSQRDGQQAQGEKVKYHRVNRVKQEAGQMIAGGVHAPQKIVQAEGYPRQRAVVFHVDRGKHPAKIIRGQPAVIRVIEKVIVIIPVHKAILQRWKEGQDGQENDQEGNQDVIPAKSFPNVDLGFRLFLSKVHRVMSLFIPSSSS